MADTPQDRRALRASDADRDAVAQNLREALAEGRLTPDEHGDRLDAVYAAKTMGELEPLTADLPAAGAPAPTVRSDSVQPFSSPRPPYAGERVVDGAPTSRFAIAVMGGADRSGHWVVPPSHISFTVWGGVNLDLREARFTARETTVWIYALMGGGGVTVPDDIHVRVHGFAFMGGFGGSGDTAATVPPDAPVVHIRGIALMGGVGVRRRPRRHQRRTEDDGED